MTFRRLNLPTGEQALLPGDIELRFYDNSGLTPQQQCATAYIPWDEKYLALVPPEYQEFFKHVLPHLGSRTTNIHTALSLSQLPYLLKGPSKPIDARTVYLAVILHDTGWSKVSLSGIADSLSYSGLALSEAARLPKEQHALIGASLAFDLLDSFDFGGQPVDEPTKRRISQIIRRHDFDAPWEKGKFANITMDTKLTCDADRLWSYTHQNFWQDTVRKHVRPNEYLETLEAAINSYFSTPQGKHRARQLLEERRQEIADYARHTD